MQRVTRVSHPHFVVVGMAGHIDHGKTALVLALTGKNTDRLKEERERGISIDIDFAPLPFPDGTVIGMVDVPGHERFIRNMVAGVAGIDAALLVVDIREGVMPQTREHMAILELLGVQRGVVALTKCDLAEPDWLPVATEVIRQELAGTVFSDAPMLATSTRTGEGVAALRAQLHALAIEVAQRDVRGAFRLPVDKVFSVPGFGTVVSGTVWRGQVTVGDVLQHLPGAAQVRVRGLQRHGHPATVAQAGQRVALNLAGVDKDDIRRGHVISQPGTLTETRRLDVRLTLLRNASSSLSHRAWVHIHLGTAESTGRVLLLEADELAPGESTFAQLLLDKELVCEASDHFVMRGSSPLTTIGGGQVVDARPARLHRRKRPHVLTALQSLASDSPRERLLTWARQHEGWLTSTDAATLLGRTAPEAEAGLFELETAGHLVALPGGWMLSDALTTTLHDMARGLQTAHQKRRFSQTVPRTAATATLPSIFRTRAADWLLEEGARRGLWAFEGAFVRLSDWEVRLTTEERALLDTLLQRLFEAGTAPPAAEELCAVFPQRDRVARSLLEYARSAGLLTEVEAGVFWHEKILSTVVKQMSNLYHNEGPFTVGRARDVLQTSRKHTVSLLEYLDKIGVTKRFGDLREICGS